MLLISILKFSETFIYVLPIFFLFLLSKCRMIHITVLNIVGVIFLHIINLTEADGGMGSH